MSDITDNLYPNDGADFDQTYYPAVEPKLDDAEQQQNAVFSQSMPIMAYINDWFSEQIENCNNVDNIRTEEITINGNTISRKLSVEAQVYAYQLLKGMLRDKQEEFKDFKHDE